MKGKEIQEYWNGITQRIIPILREAEQRTPEEYEAIFNTQVLPAIFGDGTKVALKDVMALDQLTGNSTIAGVIGRNFNESSTSILQTSVARFHHHLIDETGTVVFPMIFEPFSAEESSGLLRPPTQGYSLWDHQDFIARFFQAPLPGVSENKAVHDIIIEIDPEVAAEAAAYAPETDWRVYNPQGFQELEGISDLGRATIASSIASGFEGHLNVANPKKYLESFPIEQDGYRHPDLTSSISFFATRNPYLRGSSAGFFTPHDGRASIVLTEGENFLSINLHEAMHAFSYQHPHENPTMFAESQIIAQEIGDPYGPSILNYESLVNPDVLSHRDDPQEAYLRPLDIAIISVNRFCSQDAIAHNATSNVYAQKFEGRFERFAPTSPDKFRPTTSATKRIAGNAIKNFACIDFPLIALKAAIDKAAQAYPDTIIGSCSDLLINIAKFALYGMTFGMNPLFISSAIAGGSAVIASERFQNMMKTCSERTGFDQTRAYDYLNQSCQSYQRLPEPLKLFAKQFVTSLVGSAIGERFGARLMMDKGQLFSAAFNSLETACTGLLSGALAATSQTMLRKVIGLDSDHRGAIAPDPAGAGAGAQAPRIPAAASGAGGFGYHADLENGGYFAEDESHASEEESLDFERPEVEAREAKATASVSEAIAQGSSWARATRLPTAHSGAGGTPPDTESPEDRCSGSESEAGGGSDVLGEMAREYSARAPTAARLVRLVKRGGRGK